MDLRLSLNFFDLDMYFIKPRVLRASKRDLEREISTTVDRDRIFFLAKFSKYRASRCWVAIFLLSREVSFNFFNKKIKLKVKRKRKKKWKLHSHKSVIHRLRCLHFEESFTLDCRAPFLIIPNELIEFLKNTFGRNALNAKLFSRQGSIE